ncbi:MAG: acetyltransferase, partial [Alphaproteobacteria bacterium]|nr:acetyltransferase [Alphaproteobacteria bacterium]
KEKYGAYVQGFKRLNLPGRIIEKPMCAFIICVNGQKIGYIQYYNAYDFLREQGYEIEGLPKSMASLDVFIGEKDWISCGLGPFIIEDFLKEHIFKHFEAVFVDPDTANIQAIRAYQKAGFQKIKTVKEGTITWMVKECALNYNVRR